MRAIPQPLRKIQRRLQLIVDNARNISKTEIFVSNHFYNQTQVSYIKAARSLSHSHELRLSHNDSFDRLHRNTRTQNTRIIIRFRVGGSILYRQLSLSLGSGGTVWLLNLYLFFCCFISLENFYVSHSSSLLFTCWIIVLMTD